MSTFTRDSRLDPYVGSSNLQRALAAQQTPAAHVRAPRHYPDGISVIILNRDRPDLLLPLCRKLRFDYEVQLAAGLGFEVLIGDTGSTDPEVLAFYRGAPAWIRLVPDLVYHFSACNNVLFFDHARFARTLFLNNDIIAEPECRSFLAMSEHLRANPRVGVVGHTLWFADGRLQHAGIDFFRANHQLTGLCYHPGAHESVSPEALRPQWSVPAVTGACLMIRSELFSRLGGFDEAYAAECQDVDLCLAASRLGYGVEICNSDRLVHLENATRPRGEENWNDRRLLVRRWSAYLAAGGA